ncbi:MAG TPA: DMT family transporter [Chitinophagaceae bacterium]|nr:DMT family transporter [Chitinophagaceae bacterium]
MNWTIFILLSFVWGSSFILMKIGMNRLTPYQVASVRMVSAGIVLLPIAIRRFREIPKKQLGYIILSGLLGSFFPAYLFCIAETKIDSALAGILNALTPICVIIVGLLFFQNRSTRNQVIGVLIGFVGLCLLFITKGKIDLTYISYAVLVVVATISYGLNVNMVNRHLHHIPSLNIAAFAFSFLLIPSLIILIFTGFFSLDLQNTQVLQSVGASALLGITGTAMATILFYILLKRAGTLFASLVTYGIPFVAILWGVLAGEMITGIQIACLLLILAGVYISRR